MSDNQQPKRAHQFRLNLGADSIKELVHSLNQIALDIEIAGQPSANCASGGYDTGYTYEYTHNPDMTHDVYIEALNAWLAAERAQPATPIDDDVELDSPTYTDPAVEALAARNCVRINDPRNRRR